MNTMRSGELLAIGLMLLVVVFLLVGCALPGEQKMETGHGNVDQPYCLFACHVDACPAGHAMPTMPGEGR